jgi:hypothetical protein
MYERQRKEETRKERESEDKAACGTCAFLLFLPFTPSLFLPLAVISTSLSSARVTRIHTSLSRPKNGLKQRRAHHAV